MRPNVLAGDVGTENLITVPLSVEHESALPAMYQTPKLLYSHEESEFERHVKSRQSVDTINGRARNVVNAILAGADDFEELGESNLRRVVTLECRACYEAAVMHGEHQGFEHGPILVVEWNVKKYGV